MGSGKNQELRTRISYRAAVANKIVHQVVYEWLKTTKSSQKTKFLLLDGWRRGAVMLLIHQGNLRLSKPIVNPERDIFLKKYLAKYLGV